MNRLRILPIINNALTRKHNGYNRDGYLFEEILSEIYKGKGYNTILTGGTNDCGVDIIAENDYKRIAIQAKNYSNQMTKKYLGKNGIKDVFKKIKHRGEIKHGEFTNARLHIYNDNIISIKPNFIEEINNKYDYCIDDKTIYGQLWIDNQLLKINDDAFNKISKLIL